MIFAYFLHFLLSNTAPGHKSFSSWDFWKHRDEQHPSDTDPSPAGVLQTAQQGDPDPQNCTFNRTFSQIQSFKHCPVLVFQLWISLLGPARWGKLQIWKATLGVKVLIWRVLKHWVWFISMYSSPLSREIHWKSGVLPMSEGWAILSCLLNSGFLLSSLYKITPKKKPALSF